jgi:hypothetical protein
MITSLPSSPVAGVHCRNCLFAGVRPCLGHELLLVFVKFAISPSPSAMHWAVAKPPCLLSKFEFARSFSWRFSCRHFFVADSPCRLCCHKFLVFFLLIPPPRFVLSTSRVCVWSFQRRRLRLQPGCNPALQLMNSCVDCRQNIQMIASLPPLVLLLLRPR